MCGTRFWEDLHACGVGMLDVDEVDIAAQLDWRWCTILGLPICR
jgi:hypothetical protein